MGYERIPENYPGPLYKYLKSQHAEMMIQEGTIRIGNLYYFRKLEGDVVRGDSNEGKLFERLFVKSASMNDGTINPKIHNYFDLSKISSGKVQISNITLASNKESKDSYMYCLTRKFDTECLKKFESDSCVRVDDTALFFDAITRSLVERGLSTGERAVLPIVYRMLNKVHWISDTEDGVQVTRNDFEFDLQMNVGYGGAFEDNWTNYLEPMWIKDPVYRDQEEVRAVWTPIGIPSGTLITNPDIARACSLYYKSGRFTHPKKFGQNC